MSNKNKHKCCECGDVAVWYNEYNHSRKTNYYCDKCIPRGAICNVDNLEDIGEPNPNKKVMWWSKFSLHRDLLRNGTLERQEDSFYYEELDEQGRRSPSDDFIYQEEGFDKKEDEKTYLLCYDDILESIDTVVNNKLGYKNEVCLTQKEEFELTDILEAIFLKYRTEDGYTIEYNVLMSNFGNLLTERFSRFCHPNVENWRLFYIRLKEVMNKTKVLV